MKASEKLALVFLAICAINLLAVILSACSWATNSWQFKTPLLVLNGIGFVAFAVLSAKFHIESCRNPP